MWDAFLDYITSTRDVKRLGYQEDYLVYNLPEFIEDGNFHRVRRCLKKGANPNERTFTEHDPYNRQDTLLMLAIRGKKKGGGTKDYLNIVNALILFKADVNAQNKLHQTALLLACQKNYFSFAKVLLEHAADPNKPDKTGVTPLMYAVEHSNGDLVALLLQYGARVYQHVPAFLSIKMPSLFEFAQIEMEHEKFHAVKTTRRQTIQGQNAKVMELCAILRDKEVKERDERTNLLKRIRAEPSQDDSNGLLENDGAVSQEEKRMAILRRKRASMEKRRQREQLAKAIKIQEHWEAELAKTVEHVRKAQAWTEEQSKKQEQKKGGQWIKNSYNKWEFVKIQLGAGGQENEASYSERLWRESQDMLNAMMWKKQQQHANLRLHPHTAPVQCRSSLFAPARRPRTVPIQGTEPEDMENEKFCPDQKEEEEKEEVEKENPFCLVKKHATRKSMRGREKRRILVSSFSEETNQGSHSLGPSVADEEVLREGGISTSLLASQPRPQQSRRRPLHDEESICTTQSTNQTMNDVAKASAVRKREEEEEEEEEQAFV